MPRLEFSRKTRRQIIMRAAGKCERCNAALKPREGEVDHILAAEFGGEATAANGRLLCRTCHAAKTKQDVRAIRKSDRQRDKHTGAVRPEGKIKSRGFAHKERPEKLPMPARKRPLYKEIEA